MCSSDLPCAELLERLAAHDWHGEVIVEISTRRAQTGAQREADLAQSLAFARLNLTAPADQADGVGRADSSGRASGDVS